ncbi:lipoprotein [Flavobacterium ginsengiterrae]|uniref:Type IV secretion system putative lipoprotein virB7 n=1 Tax=Flavobacterium ginsengiterrae TaxID=871695 RepID=A0ABP7GM77_9FLAO
MKKYLILLVIILALSGCGSNTTIVNSWRDPKITVAQEHFKKVLVVALVKDEASRRIAENRIAASNPIFKTSYQYLNETTKQLTQEQKLKILQDENFDGVVTMRLVSTEKETTYVPGSYTGMYYGGFDGLYSGMYGYGFGNWYGMYSPAFYDPGYYQETTYYMVETNIFSLKENKLIWTGTTRSDYVTDVGQTVDAIMQAVVKEMRKDGSLPPK